MSDSDLNDQWDAPIGTAEERAAAKVWPGLWIDACPHGTRYHNPATGLWAVHTGADLNLNFPHFNADAHARVYAPFAGVVHHALALPVWGNVIIIEHLTETGKVWTRYGHVENMLVHPGQSVTRGQPLCGVGNGSGAFPYHLHYDIARFNLATKPGHWPGDRASVVAQDYYDPLAFTRLRHSPAPDGSYQVVILAQPRMRVRKGPSLSAEIVGHVRLGEIKRIMEVREGWGRLEDPVGWIALRLTARYEGEIS